MCFAGVEGDAQAAPSPHKAKQDTEANTTVDPDAPEVIWLYITLHFLPDAAGTVSRFEVFCRTDAPGSSEADQPLSVHRTEESSKTGWTWLGTAFAHQFRVTQLEVPFSSSIVEFAVQPADALGKLVPFQNATAAAVVRP